MKYLTLALVCLGFSLPLMGQMAHVVALTPEETARAQALETRRIQLSLDQVTFDEAIRKKYVKSGEINDWLGDFAYSDDYRYIVPGYYIHPQILNNQLPYCGIVTGGGDTYISH